MLGTDADRALRRLVQMGYIRRVRSKSSRCYFYPIEGPRDTGSICLDALARERVERSLTVFIRPSIWLP